ncbi:methylated-DNA--[protein]-cysteine S-methyltransferase [Candidatus Nitrospira bockiana]
MSRHLVFATSWGWMGVAASAAGVTRVVLPMSTKQAAAAELGEGRFGTLDPRPGQDDRHASSIVMQAKEELLEFLDGTRTVFTVPLDLAAGSGFQRRVWHALLRIPYGRVRSYRWVADRVGGAAYARAVGGACGANPVPLIVPCHRVVAADGRLGGFSCGLRAKRRLLEHEGTLSALRRRRCG